jgi:hypothetical protein
VERRSYKLQTRRAVRKASMIKDRCSFVIVYTDQSIEDNTTLMQLLEGNWSSIIDIHCIKHSIHYRQFTLTIKINSRVTQDEVVLSKF